MNLLKIIKNNLFIQNFVANIASFIPPYLEFSLGKYFAIKKAMYITAHDKTSGSYLEFGVFTGSSFNFAMKTNRKIEKIFGPMDCEFIGFDSFSGFGEVKKEDENPAFKNHTFSVFVVCLIFYVFAKFLDAIFIDFGTPRWRANPVNYNGK